MKKILFASLLGLSVLSCKENKHHADPIVENAVDQSESSVSGSLKRSGNENLIDQIYDEVIKNDKKLKALDDRVLITQQETEKTLQVYNRILARSESYYQEAGYQAKSITDSLLKQQVEKEIKASSDQYNLKVKDITGRIILINRNATALNNLYTAFKIRKTLPEIEKYQKGHPLKADSLNAVINKQNKLLEEIKNFK